MYSFRKDLIPFPFGAHVNAFINHTSFTCEKIPVPAKSQMLYWCGEGATLCVHSVTAHRFTARCSPRFPQLHMRACAVCLCIYCMFIWLDNYTPFEWSICCGLFMRATIRIHTCVCLFVSVMYMCLWPRQWQQRVIVTSGGQHRTFVAAVELLRRFMGTLFRNNRFVNIFGDHRHESESDGGRVLHRVR